MDQDQLPGQEHTNPQQEHRVQQAQVDQEPQVEQVQQAEADHQAQQDQVDHILHHLDTAMEEADPNEEILKYDLSWFIFIVFTF